MVGSAVLARQRAGSFARRNSWQLDGTQINEITFLPRTDINFIIQYHLHVGLLSTSPGDLSPLEELVRDLKRLQRKDDMDPSFTEAWIEVEDRIATALRTLRGSPAIASQAPFEPVFEMLMATQTVAEKTRDADDLVTKSKAKVQEMLDNVAGNDRILEEFRRAPRFTEEVLPSSIVGVDGFRQGWQDEWWKSGQRQRTLEALEHQWEQWSRDEDRDQHCLQNREWLKEAIGATKGELQATDAVQKLKNLQPPLSSQNIKAFTKFLANSEERREDARKDVQLVSKLRDDLGHQNEEASTAFDKSAQYMHDFIVETERRIRQTDRDLQKLEEWRKEEDSRISDMALPSSPKINALRAEVKSLKERLREAEDELKREIDLWLRESQPDNSELMAQLSKELEVKYAADRARLLAIKELLAEERNRCSVEASRREAQEDERKREMKKVLGLLEERQHVLDRTFRMFDDLTTITRVAQESWRDLYRSIDTCLDVRLMENTPHVSDLHLQGLEAGGKLCEVAMQTDANYRERIAAIDTTLKHLNTLLEFNVDTYDPYAHRFQVIREDIVVMRHRLEEALTENIQTFRYLKDEVLPLRKHLLSYDPHGQGQAALDRLARQYPTFFDLQLDRSGCPIPATVTRGSTPRSRYVTAVRKETAAASNGSLMSSPATSPHSPLPWVEARRWEMPDDELGFSPHSGHNGILSTTWPRTKKGTLNGTLAEINPASPRRFDHRDFHLSKLLR